MTGSWRESPAESPDPQTQLHPKSEACTPSETTTESRGGGPFPDQRGGASDARAVPMQAAMRGPDDADAHHADASSSSSTPWGAAIRCHPTKGRCLLRVPPRRPLPPACATSLATVAPPGQLRCRPHPSHEVALGTTGLALRTPDNVVWWCAWLHRPVGGGASDALPSRVHQPGWRACRRQRARRAAVARWCATRGARRVGRRGGGDSLPPLPMLQPSAPTKTDDSTCTAAGTCAVPASGRGATGPAEQLSKRCTR